MMFTKRNLKHIVRQMGTNKIVSGLFVAVILALAPMSGKGQTLVPQWMHRLPQPNPANNTYTFIRISADASSLDMGRSKCFQLLALDQSLLNTLTISYSSKDYITSTSQTQNGTFSENLNQKTFEVITTEGTPIEVKARVIDEYFVPNRQFMTTLYQVALSPNAIFDECSFTTSYASDPATWGLSLIPGAAQMHKGSYLKGGLIMGGTVALAGAALAMENLRNANVAKIDQSHSADVRKQYNDRATTCTTTRNICLGGLAALYIYNIVDAYVAPGARRIIVTPSATIEGQYGMAVSYKF